MSTEKKKTGTVVSIILNIVLVILTLTLGIIIAFVVSGEKRIQQLFIFGYKPFIITSDSMSPLLKTNSLVIIKKGDYQDAQVDDIIAFKPQFLGGEQYVMHRVVEVTADGLVTKGDNNPVVDQFKTTPTEFVGFHVGHFNLGADLINLVKKQGVFKIIILPILIIVIVAVGIKMILFFVKKI